MKAAVRVAYGPPDVVRVAEVPEPVVKDGELLVAVHATTVNRTDCALRAAKPFFWRVSTGLVRPKITILGNEFAGRVEAVGRGVTAFKTGDRVFGYNDVGWGAHAEYMTISQHGTVALVPDGLTYDEVAPGLEGAHYALTIIRGAGVRAGHDVLVNGATGAIGSAAVQLLRIAGARVTAVCERAHAGLVSGLGAERVIDYTTEDFTKDAGRYDAVIDAVGKSTYARCRRLLKPRGVYVASDLGPLWQNPFLALAGPLLGGRRVRFPLPRNDAATARHFAELMASGEFKPVIDRFYPLDDIVAAHRYVETGRKTGNVVITVSR
ncbi:NAD(P)-dependent alcohol dehydrogenase [Nonomuraea aridisoli]|uniref:NAD(P)-dependent alcohol dehydrogenase n=1 Tax=Nonomuraea aridisoli TaxID=2070368 RepID=A0A2W2E7H5_9ACTN|nr:NAD(P)-dependent alcohol dehydrogenase [Nonomuraea aridisoli]PZG20002.1 NAD(P)-dependent alcohol dehydrogenase [Nonomuraea aridisoli]